jgi:hypothetical protein
MVNRITPVLGPDVEQTATVFYWDTNNVSVAGVQRVSYPLGTKVTGSDGLMYVMVKAAAAFAANAAVQFTIAGGYSATAGGTTYIAPVAVANGDFFMAKQVATAI